MECREVVMKYESYRLGRLSDQESESIAEHIQDCEKCFRMDENNRGPSPSEAEERFVANDQEVHE